MSLFALNDKAPQIAESAWVAHDANIIGDVRLEAGSNVWFGSTLRGDNEPIIIGEGSNVQENCVFHTDTGGTPVVIGKGCTIGHKVMLHGCSVGDNSLIGMNATVLDGATIGANCLVGAGALVTGGKDMPEGHLILGAPAKPVRKLTDEEIAKLIRSALNYQKNAQAFAKGLTKLD